MTRPNILLVSLLALLTTPSVLAGNIVNATTSNDCDNYGNQVEVASRYTCKGTTDCTNYGVQVFVLTNRSCPGHACPNEGVRVAVLSRVCGHDTTQACIGDTCAGLPESMLFSTAASSGDCIPWVYQDEQGHLHIVCNTTTTPCGISQQPICWTVRFTCMNAAVTVLRIYDATLYDPQQGGPTCPKPTRYPCPPERSSCEGQPGWSG